MNKIQKMKEFKGAVLADATMTLMEASESKKAKAGMAGLAVGATAVGATMPFMAAGDIFDTASTMLSSVYKNILGLAMGIAVLMGLIAFIRYMVSSDPQAAKAAIQSGKRVIIALICIGVLGAVSTFVAKLTAGSGFGGTSLKDNSF